MWSGDILEDSDNRKDRKDDVKEPGRLAVDFVLFFLREKNGKVGGRVEETPVGAMRGRVEVTIALARASCLGSGVTWWKWSLIRRNWRLIFLPSFEGSFFTDEVRLGLDEREEVDSIG